MKMEQRSLRQIRWIAIALGVLVLVGGGWWVTEKLGLHPLGTMTEVFQPDTQNTKEMAGMDMTAMSGPADLSSSQAPLKVSATRQQMIGVKTAVVEKRRLSTTVRAVGNITYNEQRITHVNLRISGWIEDLFLDFTGQLVQKGQPLFTLYSPELVATQAEYLLAVQAFEDVQQSPLPQVHQQTQQVVDAARDRLRLWTFTDDQIKALKVRGAPTTSVTIFSPISGHVIDKTAFQGMFVKPEMTLYTIADLSTIWVQADVYEFEVPFIQIGQAATLTLEAFPGETFSGRVTYIYPYLNKESRTVQVRLEFANPQIRLKPDMYGTVLIQVDRGPTLAIPDQAVLDSGLRQVVFVAQEKGMFKPRDITLGPRVGSFFEVTNGLNEGERIVTSGTFLLDSESRLMATGNMMGALGMGGIQMEQAQMGEMDMGGMEMGGPESDVPTPTAVSDRERKVDGLTVELSTDPAAPRIGENTIRVTVTAEKGTPLSKANVQLTYTMPMPGMTPATIPMRLDKDGVYETKANLGMGGQWDLTVTIQRSGRPDVNATFSVTAGAGGGMSGMQGM